MRKIIAKDYDDSILCTSLISYESKKQNIDALHIKKPLYLKISLKILEIESIKYIEFLKKQGTIYIVTNSDPSWVEYSCKYFLPGLWKHIENIEMGLKEADPDYQKHGWDVRDAHNIQWWSGDKGHVVVILDKGRQRVYYRSYTE